MKKVWNFFGVALCLSLLMSGCAKSIGAIDNRTLSVATKQTDTVFLNPVTLEKNKAVYVRVTNTSDFQEIDILPTLKEKLAAHGIKLIASPAAAKGKYMVQANLLYFGKASDKLTMDGIAAGGFGGGLTGYALGDTGKAGGLGVLGGALVGGVIGSMFSVDEYLGAVDLQVLEPLGKTVKVDVTSIHDSMDSSMAGAAGGAGSSGTSSTTTRKMTTTTDSKEYRTRIVVSAKQTNIVKEHAIAAITEKLATQIAGMFVI